MYHSYLDWTAGLANLVHAQAMNPAIIAMIILNAVLFISRSCLEAALISEGAPELMNPTLVS